MYAGIKTIALITTLIIALIAIFFSLFITAFIIFSFIALCISWDFFSVEKVIKNQSDLINAYEEKDKARNEYLKKTDDVIAYQNNLIDIQKDIISRYRKELNEYSY